MRENQLRYCSFCGAIKTPGGPCDCTTAPSPAQRGWGPARGPTRQPRDPDSDRKTANKVIIGGFLLLLVVVAVCSWRINSGSENRSAQAEADNIAAYQRMNINLGDCYRWLVQFDDQKQALIAQGHGQSSAEAVAIEETKRNHTYAEYRAILQRCGVLWGQATEEEKLRAMRQ